MQYVLVTLALGKERQADLMNSMARHPSLLGQFQIRERTFPQTKMISPCRMTAPVVHLPLHACVLGSTYALEFIHRFTHTDTCIHMNT